MAASQSVYRSTKIAGWLCHESGDIESFLKANKPSEASDGSVYWISVSNPQRQQKEESFDVDIDEMFNQLTTAGRVTEDGIKAIATAANEKTGKWLVYRKPELIDEVWSKVARAVYGNKLGFSAKVSSQSAASQTGTQVICVYTYDYTDVDDVMRVEKGLRDIGVTGYMSYKPDIYTSLGIYKNNPWKIKPTVYNTNF